MNKVTFIKEFQMSRRLQRSLIRLEGETDKEYERRIRITKYGLEGEDNVNYQLESLRLPLVCLSDVRVDFGKRGAQADFVVISKNKIFIVEVKNLFGSIRITRDKEVIRILPRKNFTEEEGMNNPFSQTQKQAVVFNDLLRSNGFNINIEIIIVMGNPRTAIYDNDYNLPIIKHDSLDMYLRKFVDENCTINEYNQMLEIGEFLKFCNNERDYNNFSIMKKKMEDSQSAIPILSIDDRKLYEELLEFRRHFAKLYDMPICNVFLNRDAENLVKYKPITKEEFVKISGLKDRKYLLFGEEIIKIIKNIRNNIFKIMKVCAII